MPPYRSQLWAQLKIGHIIGMRAGNDVNLKLDLRKMKLKTVMPPCALLPNRVSLILRLYLKSYRHLLERRGSAGMTDDSPFFIGTRGHMSSFRNAMICSLKILGFGHLTQTSPHRYRNLWVSVTRDLLLAGQIHDATLTPSSPGIQFYTETLARSMHHSVATALNVYRRTPSPQDDLKTLEHIITAVTDNSSRSTRRSSSSSSSSNSSRSSRE